MRSEEPSPLSEHRVWAKRLLNQLRRAESEAAAEPAANRLRQLRSFSDKTTYQMAQEAKLKHALAVVAVEEGYESWKSLKSSMASAESPEYMDPTMYEGEMDVFLNRWFVDYEQARESLEEEGGFLLPYGRQYFVCDRGAIRMLGLDPDDPDWALAGHDWVEPRDREAWLRLAGKREQAIYNAL